MSNFYTTLGNALFGADFRDEMSKIKAAAAAVAEAKKKVLPKAGSKKKGAAAAAGKAAAGGKKAVKRGAGAPGGTPTKKGKLGSEADGKNASGEDEDEDAGADEEGEGREQPTASVAASPPRASRAKTTAKNESERIVTAEVAIRRVEHATGDVSVGSSGGVDLRGPKVGEVVLMNQTGAADGSAGSASRGRSPARAGSARGPSHAPPQRTVNAVTIMAGAGKLSWGRDCSGKMYDLEAPTIFVTDGAASAFVATLAETVVALFSAPAAATS